VHTVVTLCLQKTKFETIFILKYLCKKKIRVTNPEHHFPCITCHTSQHYFVKQAEEAPKKMLNPNMYAYNPTYAREKSQYDNKQIKRILDRFWVQPDANCK